MCIKFERGISMKKKPLIFILLLFLFLLIQSEKVTANTTILNAPNYATKEEGNIIFAETGRYSLGSFGHNQVEAGALRKRYSGNNKTYYYDYNMADNEGTNTTNATSAVYTPNGEIKQAFFYILENENRNDNVKNTTLTGPKGGKLIFSSNKYSGGAYDVTTFLKTEGPGQYSFDNFNAGITRKDNHDKYAVWNITYVEEKEDNPIRRTVLSYFGIIKSVTQKKPLEVSIGGETGFKGSKKKGNMRNSMVFVAGGTETSEKNGGKYKEEFQFNSILLDQSSKVTKYDKGFRVFDALNETYTRDGSLFRDYELTPYPEIMESDVIIDNNLTEDLIPLNTYKVTAKAQPNQSGTDTNIKTGIFGLGLEMEQPDVYFRTRWQDWSVMPRKLGHSNQTLTVDSTVAIQTDELKLSNKYLLIQLKNSLVNSDILEIIPDSIKVNNQAVEAIKTNKGLKIPLNTKENYITVLYDLKLKNTAEAAYERLANYLKKPEDNLMFSLIYDLTYPDGTIAKAIEHDNREYLTVIPEVGKTTLQFLDETNQKSLKTPEITYGLVGTNHATPDPINIVNYRFSNKKGNFDGLFEMPTATNLEKKLIYYYNGFVTMHIKQINSIDKTAVYQNITTSEKTKNNYTTKIAINDDIKTKLATIFKAKELTLGLTGYDDMAIDNYTVNNTKITNAPNADFTVVYTYQPQTRLEAIPDLDFGQIKVANTNKETKKVKNENTSLKVINTNPSRHIKIELSLPSGIINTTTNTPFLGQLYLNNEHGKTPISNINQSLKQLEKGTPYIDYDLNNDQNYFVLLQKTGNLAHQYRGTLVWTILDAL